MRQFQTSGHPAYRLPGATFTVVVATAIFACRLDSLPPELKPMVDSRLPRAVSLAESAALRCAEHKGADGPAPPVSPARGTSLSEELEVVEILVRCDWGQRDATQPESGAGSFSFPPLRQAAPHAHSPPPELRYDTFVKHGDQDFERVHVPSQFSQVATSADIVVTRPIPGGGTVEVTVAMVKR